MSVQPAPPAILALLLLLGTIPRQPVNAQEASAPLVLTRITEPVVIDGVPNDPVWRDVPALPLTEYTPVFRGTPTQRTVIKVAYDDENFYAAGWFYDNDPSGIRINSLYRDRWNGDDAFAIYDDEAPVTRGAKRRQPRRISGAVVVQQVAPLRNSSSSCS